MKAKCPFNPTIYKDKPIGMFHCPWCGEMVLAGILHVDYDEIEFEEEEYKTLVKVMEEELERYGISEVS
jgi:hypothetical protein